MMVKDIKAAIFHFRQAIFRHFRVTISPNTYSDADADAYAYSHANASNEVNSVHRSIEGDHTFSDTVMY